MPSNIDFSQFRPDPNIFKADDEWVNRLYQYAAKRDAGQMYAGGDYQGAANRLAQSGDLAGATTLGAAATKAANDAQDQIIQNFDAQQKFIKSAAPLLSQGFASHGAEGLKQGWDSYVAPHMKSLGAKDEDITKLGQMIQANPDVLKQLTLGELTTEKLNNGDVLVIDKGTGRVVNTIKGTPNVPPNFRATADGGYEPIPGSAADLDYIAKKAKAEAKEGTPAQGTVLQTPDGKIVRIVNGTASLVDTSALGGAGLAGATKVGAGTPGAAAIAAGHKLYIDRIKGNYFTYNEKDPNDKPKLLDGTPYEPSDFTLAPTLSQQTGAANALVTSGGAGAPNAVNQTVVDARGAAAGAVAAANAANPSLSQRSGAANALVNPDGTQNQASIDARAASAGANAGASAAATAPFKDRKVLSGDDIVTYNYDPATKSWVETARAPRSANNTQSTVPLSKDALRTLAEGYTAGGPIPPFGTGQAARADRDGFYEMVNEITRGARKTGVDVAADRADFKANSGALNTIVRLQSNIRQFEGTATRNADLVLESGARGVGPSNVPLFNSWIQAGRRGVGSTEVRNFDIAIKTFLSEYAKVMQGQTGASGTTDAARKEALDLIQTSDSWDTVKSSIAFLKREMKNREDALEDEVQTRRGMLRGKGLGVVQPDTQTPATTQTPPPGGIIDYDKNGKRVVR